MLICFGKFTFHDRLSLAAHLYSCSSSTGLGLPRFLFLLPPINIPHICPELSGNTLPYKYRLSIFRPLIIIVSFGSPPPDHHHVVCPVATNLWLTNIGSRKFESFSGVDNEQSERQATSSLLQTPIFTAPNLLPPAQFADHSGAFSRLGNHKTHRPLGSPCDSNLYRQPSSPPLP